MDYRITRTLRIRHRIQSASSLCCQHGVPLCASGINTIDAYTTEGVHPYGDKRDIALAEPAIRSM